MTVHSKQSQKRRKSKIILPLQIDTTLLPKKRKNTKLRTKKDEIKTNFYKKTKYNNRVKLTKHQKYLSRSTQSPYYFSLDI